MISGFFSVAYAQSDNILSLASVTVGRIMKLIDERTPDGSRHFARLPQITAIKAVRDHALLLKNAKVVNYVDQENYLDREIAKPWFDFTFRGHRFLVHSGDGQFLLFVRDPQCPDLMLFEVGHHFELLLSDKRAKKST